ncbi:MAG: ribose-phosphate pyrophosphokinase [Planctomycetes bacterium]|nr:ribose-phosphate pyrophosphokinase [Planctomycetota bacterium]
MPRDKMQVFAGRASTELAEKVCAKLSIPLGKAEIRPFPDGEIDLKVIDDVRGSDVFIIQSTSAPADSHLMELLIFIDCLKRASVERITAVIPYFGYARQDRKAEGRVPITAKLVANLITTAGADRVLTIDLHAAQIQGFFDIPVDHLFSSPVMIEYIKHLRIPKLIVVAPDVGGVKLARAYAKHLAADLAIVDKRRIGPRQTEAMQIIGDIKGKNILMVDDMISTATTISNAAEIMRSKGAKNIYVCATHAVLTEGSLQKLQKARFNEVVLSDTIYHNPKTLTDQIRILSVSGMLAEAIRRIHYSESVSSLFI